MRVDRQVDFLDCVFVLARDSQLMNHLGGMRADDVRAKYLAVLRVANDLDEAFGLSGCASAAVGGERKLPDLVVDLLFFYLGFGHANRCNLRMAVRRIWNVAVIDRVDMLLAGEELGEDHTFPLAFVGEHRWPGDIADSVDPFDRSLHSLVDLDESPIGELDAELLDANVFNDGRAPRRNENFFDFQVLLLSADVNAHGD